MNKLRNQKVKRCFKIKPERHADLHLVKLESRVLSPWKQMFVINAVSRLSKEQTDFNFAKIYPCAKLLTKFGYLCNIGAALPQW